MQSPHRFLSPKACLLLAAGFTVLLSGCADSHDKAMSDVLDNMRQYNDILETIDDTQSAEDAKSKLDKCYDKTESLDKRWQDLGQPSTEVAQQLAEKYKGDFQKEDKRTAAIFIGALQSPSKMVAITVVIAHRPSAEKPSDFSLPWK